MKTRALLLALPLLALSCRDNSASVQIQQICYPTDDCVFSPSCDQVLIGNPRIDTGTGDGSLGVFLQVSNQLQDNANADTWRTNTHDAHVDEIGVEYKGVALPEQTTLTNQRVPTNATQVIGVVAVPPNTSLSAPSTVLALVRMRGYYDDGSRFETAEFPIAVDVCAGAGCVTSCVTAATPLVCGGNDGQEPKTCFDPTGGGST